MKILHIYILQIVLLVIRYGNSMELSSSGEYTGVTVKLHEDLSQDNCQQVLDNLQDLLERTSESVGVASGGRVWPSQYIVVLPSSWSGSPCSDRGEIPRGITRFKSDDIIISDGPLVYGAHPYTVQPKGCGEKGAYISLPLSYLRDNSSWEEEGAGKLMAHQFFKLRFGLFDEEGYPDDPLYPNYYKHQGRILPTGSTNMDVTGVWLTEKGMSPCAPDNEVCVFHPQGDNDGLICSLGYLPQLEGTTRYCTPEQTNFRIPPTKQNVICEGKSAHEIIEGSEDYRLLSGTTDSNSSFVPRVDFVLTPREKIVLVLETSSSMGEDEDWKWIQKVAHKLIRYDLPSSIEVGVVSFSNESKVEYPLTKLESARGKLADSVPDKYRLSADNGRCVICGINTALQDVLGENRDGAHIILFTRGGQDTLSLTDETRIKEFIMYYQIKLSAILIPEQDEPYKTFYDVTASISGGRTMVVPPPRRKKEGGAKNGVSMYMKLAEAVSEILDTDGKTEIIQSEIYSIGRNEEESCGSFLVPTSLDSDLENRKQSKVQFGIVVEDTEDHLIRSVSFISEDGTEWGPYQRIATTYDNINIKVVNFGLEAPPPFQTGTQWRYKIAWHVPSSSVILQAGLIISVPKQERSINIKFWSSSDSSSDFVTSQHPLALYVAVNRDLAPVLNAQVLISVTVLTENSTELKMPPFNLFDNGNGDPDIQGSDGIYSRYMTEYPAIGRYIFTVTVSDNSGEAVYVTKALNVTERSSGNYLKFSNEELKSMGVFSRMFNIPGLNLLQVPTSNDIDRMPPGKVGDLQIEVLPASMSLLATWTAPGDNYDSGIVRGYIFFFSNSIGELLDPTQDAPILVELDRSDTAGVHTSFQFKFSHVEEQYYIGIVGIDSANNTGKISNIVSVIMPTIIADSSQTVEDRSVEMSIEGADSDWTMIGALCGAILLLGLFLLAGIIYFLKFAKPKKPIVIPVHGRDDGTDSNCSTDSKNTSSHRLMPDITTVAGTLPLFQAPPSTLPDSTPTYWSATQLLTEHEQRALNLSYSAIHSPMETIREEYIGYPEEFPESSRHDPGITNLGFSRNNNGTPIHGVFTTREGSIRSGKYRLEPEDPSHDRHSAASSNLSESVISVGSNLFRSMGSSDPEGEPVRYSTAVQTTAPSTTASMRYNRTRNVSLV